MSAPVPEAYEVLRNLFLILSILGAVFPPSVTYRASDAEDCMSLGTGESQSSSSNFLFRRGCSRAEEGQVRCVDEPKLRKPWVFRGYPPFFRVPDARVGVGDALGFRWLK